MCVLSDEIKTIRDSDRMRSYLLKWTKRQKETDYKVKIEIQTQVKRHTANKS